MKILRLFDNLRGQVLLILAVAIVPLVALSIYLAIDDGRRDAAKAQAEVTASVELVSQNIAQLIQSSRDLLAGFSEVEAIRRHGAACDSLLSSLLPSFPQFANLALADKDYRLLCAGRNPTNLQSLPRTTEDSELMERVFAKKVFAVGAVRMGIISQHPVLPLVSPISNPEGTLIFATLDLVWLRREIELFRPPGESILLVIDRYGNIIGRNPASPDWPLGHAVPDYERTLAGKTSFDGEITGDDRVKRLYSLRQVKGGDGIFVVMKVRSSQINGRSRRRLFIHLVGLGCIGAIVFGLAWHRGNRRFIRPLSSLAGAANQLAAGDLTVRSKVPYRGELGELAQSFDHMAGALQQDRARILTTSAVLRSIFEGTAAATGEEFFRSLALNLAATLHADYVLVGELNEPELSISTLAVCADGAIAKNMVYRLEGTPCHNVMVSGDCSYPRNVAGLFPDDIMLRDLAIDSYLGAPLLDGNARPIGLIAVLSRSAMEHDFIEASQVLKIFSARAAAELSRLGAERDLRVSMEKNIEMVASLQALAARLESVREEERSHIAREIHDELGQQLTAMRFDLSALKTKVTEAHLHDEVSHPLLHCLGQLKGAVDSLIVDVRRIATELRPTALDMFGLVAGIEWLAADFEKRTGIHCEYTGPEEVQANRDLGTAAFRICQESLTNVARHSGATEVRIVMALRGTSLCLKIRDNGKGLPVERPGTMRSLGILGMRERARIAGGELTVASATGIGVTVACSFPLADSGDAGLAS